MTVTSVKVSPMMGSDYQHNSVYQLIIRFVRLVDVMEHAKCIPSVKLLHHHHQLYSHKGWCRQGSLVAQPGNEPKRMFKNHIEIGKEKLVVMNKWFFIHTIRCAWITWHRNLLTENTLYAVMHRFVRQLRLAYQGFCAIGSHSTSTNSLLAANKG